jgi:RNA polymerase sigma-70 factor (ECF subfamily)
VRSAVDESLDNWFAREILPHEDALVRYLTRTWSNREEIHDLRQEVYIRVYEAARRSRPLSPKSFMFTTARHLMADRIRRGRVVSIEATADLDALNVLIDEISPEQRASARQELGRLADAFDLLPPQCRKVVWMRKVEGVSQRDVAMKLGISEGAVEKQITKGVRLLARSLFGGEGREGGVEQLTNDSEVEHGKQYSD